MKYITEDFNSKEILRKMKIQETQFKVGNALSIARKTARIISRRINIPIWATPIPEIFNNNYGKFKSFFSFMGDRAIRFNFLLGKSDIFHSIDLFDTADDVVSQKNISLEGYNIVQVIDQVVDVITGEWLRWEESLKVENDNKLIEKITLQEMVAAWLQQNPNYVQDIKSGSFDYQNMVPEFLNFIRVTYKSSKSKLSVSALQWNVKEAFKTGNFGVSPGVVPSVQVRKGVPDQKIYKDPDMQALYEEAVNPPPKEVLEEMERDVRLIVQGTPTLPGLFLYGKPGSGKSETVKRVFKEEGVRPVLITQRVTAYSKFLYSIIQNRADEVLVFDDNDSVLDSEDNVLLLKNVLDMKPVRTIHVTIPQKVADMKGVAIEEGEYEFTSKIIFISNRSKIDPALESRLKGVTHELNFTKQEMLELIKDSLYNMYAEFTDEITNEMRDEVFDFCVKALPGFGDIDYRAFNYVLSFRLSSEKTGDTKWWKKRAIRMLYNYSTEFTKG